jgi:hypothetical protein
VTFLGSESGLLFADRTDFITRPGQPIPGGDTPATSVPEPSTLFLAGGGLLALAGRVRRSIRATRP